MAVAIQILPDHKRGLVVLQITELPNKPLAHAELTPDLLENILAGLASARLQMATGGSEAPPGRKGLWGALAAISDPAWKIGGNPIDGTIVLSFRANQAGPDEMWLSYALPRHEAENLRNVLTEGLSRPTHEGTA